MSITTATVAELRARTNAGILDCKKALEESGGDLDKAAEILRVKGIAKADKKGDRDTNEGLVYAYVHGTGKVGTMVEVLCETDFVARNEQFKEFVHDVAMHITASSPLYVAKEDVPDEVLQKERELAAEEYAGSGKPHDVIAKIVEGKLGKYFEDVCLLEQKFIKDEDKTVGELVKETISKVGENIQIKKFVRYQLG